MDKVFFYMNWYSIGWSINIVFSYVNLMLLDKIGENYFFIIIIVNFGLL